MSDEVSPEEPQDRPMNQDEYRKMLRLQAEVTALTRSLNAAEGILARLECRVTNNPVGTDTWPAGLVCPCNSCQTWLAAKEKPNG